MVSLPDQYVVEKFCQYSGYPKYNKRSKTWAGGCPMCREGSSWGKKRRLYYKLDKNYVFCFNCGWKGSTIDFVKHMTGMSFGEVLNESNNYTTNDVIESVELPKNTQPTNIPSLPHDSINLFDETQMDWWLHSNETDHSQRKTVVDLLNIIKCRKLDTAVNRPKSLWLSHTDFTHRDRLILPFYSKNGKIIFYQSRTVYDNPNIPKYLSKTGGDKSIFNINQIDMTIDSIFLFEGPIDSCFVKNGVGVAGITNGPGEDLTSTQQSQLSDFRLYDKIWVLDSQWLDQTSRSKTQLLIEQGHKVFIWPESIGRQYKDLNDMCVGIDKPGIGHKFVEKNSHTGMKAQLLINQIPTNR
jgi:hypothetical protein